MMGVNRSFSCNSHVNCITRVLKSVECCQILKCLYKYLCKYKVYKIQSSGLNVKNEKYLWWYWTGWPINYVFPLDSKSTDFLESTIYKLTRWLFHMFMAFFRSLYFWGQTVSSTKWHRESVWKCNNEGELRECELWTASALS